MILWCCKETW